MPLPDIKSSYSHPPFPYVPKGKNAARATDSMLGTASTIVTSGEHPTTQLFHVESIDDWELLKYYREWLGKSGGINSLKDKDAKEPIDTFGSVEGLEKHADDFVSENFLDYLGKLESTPDFDDRIVVGHVKSRTQKRLSCLVRIRSKIRLAYRFLT